MRGRDRLSNGPERADSIPDLIPRGGRGGDSVVGMALLAAAIPVAVLVVAYPALAVCLLAGALSGIAVRRLVGP